MPSEILSSQVENKQVLYNNLFIKNNYTYELLYKWANWFMVLSIYHIEHNEACLNQ